MEPPYVICCSRRTDVPACYSAWLAQALRTGTVAVRAPFGGLVRQVSLRPQDVHSIVLLSKDYGPLLDNRDGILDLLAGYEQICCQLTITGLGGSALEPTVPPWQTVGAQLLALVALTGDARRVSLRYDPIVHWREGERVRSNLDVAPRIMDLAASAGVRLVRVSIAALYHKTRRRGVTFVDPGPQERGEIAAYLQALAAERGLLLQACADPSLAAAGIEPSACVDGRLLSALHPRHLPLPVGKDRGQRAACGCTPSVDIGSYDMICGHGCRYCYARPAPDEWHKEPRMGNGARAR
ncbi:MAG: DUF1848 family protein [Anaerolineae bacterium]